MQSKLSALFWRQTNQLINPLSDSTILAKMLYIIYTSEIRLASQCLHSYSDTNVRPGVLKSHQNHKTLHKTTEAPSEAAGRPPAAVAAHMIGRHRRPEVPDVNTRPAVRGCHAVTSQRVEVRAATGPQMPSCSQHEQELQRFSRGGLLSTTAKSTDSVCMEIS